MYLNEARREIAGKLRRLRLEARVSTRDLAERTGFSQSKISKIERAQRGASPKDVLVILNCLDVRDEIRRSLVQAARSIRNDNQVEYTKPRGAIATMEECITLENDSHSYRVVRSDLVPLWFQTPAYIDAYYSHSLTSKSRESFVSMKLHAQARAYADRKERQVILDGTVLTRPILPHSEWLEMLEFMKLRLKLSNVELGVLPVDGVSVPPVGSWATSDKTATTYESFASPLVIDTDRDATSRQIERFDALARFAQWGRDAVAQIDEALLRLNSIDLRSYPR